MIQKVFFKNYKSFKDWQELDILPMTILIGKNSSGKSAIAKLLALIENSLKGENEAPLKLTGYDNGVELGAEFEDLIYGRSRTGKLELAIVDKENRLDLVVGTEKEIPKIFSWKFNDTEKLGFDNTFKGFHLETKNKNLQIDDFTLNIDYIGPLRLNPPREFSELNLNIDVVKIGYKGEGAYTLLLQDGLTTISPLVSRVNEWYESNFEGWGVQINKDLAPFYQVEVTRKKSGINVNLKDVGQGMSQALPLVVKAMVPVKEEELITIEQPELHLHPAAHGNLAELFVESLEQTNRFYLIETHSPNLILRLRRLIAEKKYSWFTEASIGIYFVDFNEEVSTSSLRRINVDHLGELDFWPTNVFTEVLDEVIALRNAQDQFTEDAN